MTSEVCRAIATEIGFPSEEVTPDSRLAEDLWMDTFDMAELVETLEAAFAVSVSDGALASMRTVSDIERELAAGIFFNVTTLKDPSLRTDGLHTVEALALGRPRAFEAWRDARPGERGSAYAALKDRIADRILEEVDRFAPGFSDRVVFRSLGTPLTNMHYLNATDGAIYGTEKTLRNLGPFSFPIRSHIDGLFQCGASTFAPGIHGVTTSGLAAAAAALECVEDELLTEAGQHLRVYPAEDPSSWPDELRPQTQAA
jgi:acyl carrier protein